MSEWIEPIDWQANQPLRSRDLNNALYYSMGWLKNRPIDVVTVNIQAADLNISAQEWTKMDDQYSLELVLPEDGPVLLFAQAVILGAGADHNFFFNVVRDDVYWLSRNSEAAPTGATADGLGEKMAMTTASLPENLLFFWWDLNATKGRHTWRLAFSNASNSFNIEQTDSVWQFGAMAW